jgi:hypothetical protein
MIFSRIYTQELHLNCFSVIQLDSKIRRKDFICGMQRLLDDVLFNQLLPSKRILKFLINHQSLFAHHKDFSCALRGGLIFEILHGAKIK